MPSSRIYIRNARTPEARWNKIFKRYDVLKGNFSKLGVVYGTWMEMEMRHTGHVDWYRKLQIHITSCKLLDHSSVPRSLPQASSKVGDSNPISTELNPVTTVAITLANLKGPNISGTLDMLINPRRLAFWI